uniref:Organic solute transporter alpha-like protein n=1 Tax=Clastoptera arizonana TaxID=38151 RepID=A0A1B6CPT7_9HEMI
MKMESAALVYNATEAKIIEIEDSGGGVVKEHLSILGDTLRALNRSSVRSSLGDACSDDTLPSIRDYFTAFNLYGVALFSLGGLALIIIVFACIDTLKHVLKYAPAGVKTHSAFIICVYPVVGLATYFATIVPRSQLLAEAITQGMFMACMYQLFCLFVAYCGGEAELIRRAKPESLNLRVGPCCCWPCCCCLPLMQIDKYRVRCLRVLILQLPLVQGFVYLIFLIMWAEKESLYNVNYIFLQPIVIFSLLSGIWGMTMTMKMLADILKEHYMWGKFIALQLVLILSKLQYNLIIKLLILALPCNPPITPIVYANRFINLFSSIANSFSTLSKSCSI